ncbi:hypothetical protein [Methylocella tundrae]|uniref:hypothetical protein n=1 Tax=Methylocella tundrae TaxID=227605 RepID=UPI00157B8EBB|nr:hypothetical protein [Methylocella tundrae]
MAILADTVFECPALKDAQMESLRLLACEALRRPWDENHSSPPHPLTVLSIAGEAETKAQLFVFDDAVIESAASILEDYESIDIAKRYARLPASMCWFEWNEDGIRVGALLTDVDDGISFVLFSKNERYGAIPVLCGEYAFHHGKYKYNVLHCKNINSKANEGYAVYISSKIFAICAFLNIPGAVHSANFRWGDKLQKSRRKRGKAPLLSFNEVKLALPKNSASRKDVTCDMGRGVRWHHVIGYLRISRHGDPEAHYTWVPSVWRGDKSSGVVLKSRNVCVKADRTRPRRRDTAGDKSHDGHAATSDGEP